MERLEQAMPKTISLYPNEWEMVDKIAQEIGVHSRSGAIRMVIREWLKWKRFASGLQVSETEATEA